MQSGFLRFVRGTAILFAELTLILCLIAAGAPLLASAIPPLSIFEHLLLQTLLGSACCFIVLLACRRWLTAAVSGALALWCVVAIGSPLISFDETSANSANPEKLKLISLNLWAGSPTQDATLRYLTLSQADVIGLVEVTPSWLAALQPLNKLYPFQIGCAQLSRDCDTLLLSKHPFARSYAGRLDSEAPAVAWAEINWLGHNIIILETHLSWPFSAAAPAQLNTGDASAAVDPLPGVPHLAQGQQAARLARYLAIFSNDVVVMGDFNSTPWSRLQLAFAKAAGLRNWGHLALSWPSWAPMPFRLPIDQIFARGAIDIEQAARGPAVDSDHFPISVIVQRRP